MSLDSISISNEGPIDEASCDEIPPLMIIAGPNGVGKSTFLRHLFDLPDEEFEEETKQTYLGPHRSPNSMVVNEKQILEFDNVSSREVFSYSENFPESPHDRLANEVFGADNFQGDIERSSLNTSADFLPYFEVKRRVFQLRSRMGHELSDEFLEDGGGVASDFWPNIDEPFRNAVDDILPGVEFAGVGLENHDYSLEFTNRDGSTVTFDELSSGEKDSIALSFLAIEHKIEQELIEHGHMEGDDEDLLMLIDGPESYLHPRLQLNYLDYIRRFVESYPDDKNIQIIMCTHSQTILNEATEEELYFLMYPDTIDGNQLKNSDDLPNDVLDDITEQLGTISLSSGKNLLLVEGPTDRDILRNLYPDIESNIDILPMSGKDAVLSRTLNELASELSEVEVRVYGIVDRDRDLDLNREVDDRIHVLPATCMENLLLKPEPLYEALVVSSGVTAMESEGVDGPDDINDFIQSTIENSDFKEKELKTRWNEDVNPTNISLSGFRDSNHSNIEDYITEVAESKVERTRSVDQHEREIQELVGEQQYDYLNGKEIVSDISDVVSEDQDRLCREIATQVRRTDTELPESTTEFIEIILHETHL